MPALCLPAGVYGICCTCCAAGDVAQRVGGNYLLDCLCPLPCILTITRWERCAVVLHASTPVRCSSPRVFITFDVFPVVAGAKSAQKWATACVFALCLLAYVLCA